ncbi:hypothetical protein ACFVYR_16610 [Streptomyces sp. NPDC058284]|uniref:hypothetical protein n=1 Tax=unclassified Streptomyces TaxID=2593676 RepID=UPI0036558BB1
MAAFIGRTFRGDWAGSVQAALWPLVLLLTGAAALAVPRYGQGDDAAVGFMDRMRVSLAMLLQSVGGGFELSGREERPGFDGTEGLGGSDGLGGTGGLGGTDGLGLGGSDASSTSGSAAEGAASLHLVPLTVTALWILALFIGVRVLRNRMVRRGALAQGGGTAGLEAAARVALLVTAGVLALALFAQPELEGIELSSSPVLAALGALLLGLAVSCAVLLRPGLTHWLAARPGAHSVLRATGAALRALAVVIALCSVVAFISLTQIDDLGDLTDLDNSNVSPLLVALLVLPNLAVTALGIGWGAGAEASVSGSSSMYGSGHETKSFGLSELGDVTNDWAVVGALALGLVCALALGVFAARRCAGRGEALLAAAVFFGLVLLLAGFSGLQVDLSGQAAGGGSGLGGSGGSGHGSVELGINIPETLLFGLLWIFPAALLGPYLLQMVGQGSAVAATPAYAPPGTPPMPMPMPGTPAGPSTGEPVGTTPAPPAVSPTADAPAGASAESPAESPEEPAAPGDAVPAAYLPTQTALGVSAPPAPGPPGTPPTGTPTPPYAHPHPQPQPQPQSQPQGAHAFQLGQQPPGDKPRGRAGIWIATLSVAFVIGGGATAGILLWQDNSDDKTDGAGKDDRPSVSRSEAPSGAPSSGPSGAPTAAASPTPEASDSTDPGTTGESEVPAGSERVTDQEGFSFAVPEGWTRQPVNPERPGQITYAGPTGREEFLVGVVTDARYTSYENFTNIEKHTRAAPDKSDYERIRLETNTFQGQDGAIWEYTYTDEANRTIHAIDQSYIAQDGTEYAIQLSWREDFWPAGEGAKTHRIALDTWRLMD